MTLPRPALPARESLRYRQYRKGTPAGCSDSKKGAGPCGAQKKSLHCNPGSTSRAEETGGRNESSAGAQPGTLARVKRDGPPQHGSASRGRRVSKPTGFRARAVAGILRVGLRSAPSWPSGVCCSAAQTAGLARAACSGEAKAHASQLGDPRSPGHLLISMAGVLNTTVKYC